MVGDAQPDAGVLGVELPQALGEVDIQRRFSGADADGTVLKGGAGAQLLFGVLDLHGGGRNARIERFTLGCQRNAAVRADKKHAVQLIFQFVHHVGDIGLVVAQHPRRLGEVLVFGDVIKNFVVFPIHVHRRAPRSC